MLRRLADDSLASKLGELLLNLGNLRFGRFTLGVCAVELNPLARQFRSQRRRHVAVFRAQRQKHKVWIAWEAFDVAVRIKL